MARDPQGLGRVLMSRVRTIVDLVLRKYPWALVLATLIPCAYFGAAGVNHLLASSLLRADVNALTRPNSSGVADPSRDRGSGNHHSRDVDQILHRNVFDSDAGCLNCAPPPTDAAVSAGDASTDAGPTSQLPPEPCTGSARVLGAVEAEDPLWSFVFLAPAPGQPSMPRRVGQMFDGQPIASIGWHQRLGAYALLRQPDGRRCFYAQVMPPRPPPERVASASPATAVPAAGETSPSLQAALDQGIERSGTNEFSVRRALVEQILENQAELMRTTRIMPHEEGGRVTGVQMFGLRPNTLLGRLGMQNGDILNRLNGLEIASPDRALEAYSRLRTADHITVSVTRGGQPVNIDFNIR